jgi:hypothetical protein
MFRDWNPIGTAPGFILETPGGNILIAIPGVPREMKLLWAETIKPCLRKKMGTALGVIEYKVLKVCGLGESRVDTRTIRAPGFWRERGHPRGGGSPPPGAERDFAGSRGNLYSRQDLPTVRLGFSLGRRAETYQHKIGGPKAVLADRVAVMALDWLRKILDNR